MSGSQRITRFVAAVAAVIVTSMVRTVTPVRAQTATPTPGEGGTGQAEITSPAERATLTGVVAIEGTAIATGFLTYQLEVAPDPTPSDVPWVPLQPPVAQQVRAGVLGVWDTTTLADGLYVLRLTVVYGDDQASFQHEIHVEVSNATSTPLPLPPTLTPTTLPGTPTPGPSPTPLIQQPPTRTPRPTSTPGGPVAAAPPALPPDSPLQPERLSRAAWQGVLMALFVFGLLAAYGLVRAGLRGQLRESLWNFRREVINPLLDGLKRRKGSGG